MKKVCPNGCKSVLLCDDFMFCYRCGAELKDVEELQCVCGKEWIDGVDFCPYCGRPREEAVNEDVEMLNALLETDRQEKNAAWVAVEDVLLPSLGFRSNLADLKAIGPDLTPLTLFYALMIVPRLIAVYVGRSDKTVQSVELASDGGIWLGDEESIPAWTVLAQIQQAAHITFETADKLFIDWIPRALMVQPRLFPGLLRSENTRNSRLLFQLIGIEHNSDALVKWWKSAE